MNIGKTMKCAVIAALALGGTEMVPASYGAIERPVPPSVVVESIQFRQRYPWNGLVDIDAKITCSDANTNLSVYVAAWDNVKDRALTVKTIWLDGDETKNPDFTVKSGTHRFIWDARADNPGEISQNVSLSVQAYVRDMRYLVIDLSGGTETNEYAYSFMPDPPEGGWTDEFKTDKLVMRLIPAGTFLMGSPADELGRRDDENQGRVTLTRPFYMAVFETTQRQYELVTGSRPSFHKFESCYATRPVESVSYNTIRGDFTDYCWPTVKKANPNTFMGLLQTKTGISTIDLPTEARWEYACRATTVSAFNNGENLTSTASGWDIAMDKVGRYKAISGGNGNVDTRYGTQTVGSYQPNAWGLFDMHGNVWEWCIDGCYSITSEIDPEHVISSKNRRIRGGSYFETADACRSALRHYAASSNYLWQENGTIGFRICCEANLLK